MRLFVILAAVLAGCALTLAPAFAQHPLPPLPVPAENPQTPAKTALGKALFWEEQLSLTGTVACGTCHRPASGGSDPRSAAPGFSSIHPGPNGLFGIGGDDIRGSAGVPLHGADGQYQLSQFFGVTPQVGIRRSPNILSAAYELNLFWDGRATTAFTDPISGQLLIARGGALESLALLPLLDTSEIGHVGNLMNGVPARLQGVRPLALAFEIPAALASWIGQRDYKALFDEVFGTPEITPVRIAFALASYQRSQNLTETPFDRELAGIPSLSLQEANGRQVFIDLECRECHVDALHTDGSFRYIGVRPVDDDLGRFNQTAQPDDRGAFRVPSLRNVALRAPYMHTGGLATLEEVVDFYLRGGDFSAPNKDPLIHVRNLVPSQRANLLAYLRNPLTDPRLMLEQPPFDRPKLYTESTRVPILLGSGVGGSAGIPVLGALEPPLVGNAKFTVSISKARVGATATLVVGRADPGVQSSIPVGDFANPSTHIAAGNVFSGGFASLQLDLSDPALSGQTLYGRWYVVDPTAVNGLAISQAFRMTVFGTPERVMRNGFE